MKNANFLVPEEGGAELAKMALVACLPNLERMLEKKAGIKTTFTVETYKNQGRPHIQIKSEPIEPTAPAERLIFKFMQFKSSGDLYASNGYYDIITLDFVLFYLTHEDEKGEAFPFGGHLSFDFRTLSWSFSMENIY